METIANPKTLITPRMAQSIAATFTLFIRDARQDYVVSVKQDEEKLKEFGVTPDSMRDAGLSPESITTVTQHQKLKVLLASAKRTKERVGVEDLYLEDEIEHTYERIRHNHASWNMGSDDVFLSAICAGNVEGLDAVLTVFQTKLKWNA